MSAPGLAARLLASESPGVWLIAVTACRVARWVSRNPSRWSFRLGYALERLDQSRRARRELREVRRESGTPFTVPGFGGEAVRQLRLARRRERRQDWPAAAAAYREAVRHDGSQPVWWYRLARCLREAGDLAGAAEAARRACAIHGSLRRYGLLAEIEEASGNLPAAAGAWQEAVRLGGDGDPRWRVRLADLHDRVGQWREAQRLLAENAERHPHHARSHSKLGEVCLKIAQWGGAFDGTLAGLSAGSFQFDTGAAAKQGRQALERAADLEPAKTTWRSALAEARLSDGDPTGAIQLYESALRDAEESTGRWVLAMKQRWQFQLELIYHQLGQPRVEDPLFECTVESAGPDAAGSPVVGLFSARTTFAGIAVTGFVATEGCEQVEILLDGAPVRAVNLGGDGYFPEFGLELKRSTLASFPRHGELEVRTPDGHRLHTTDGTQRLRLTVPHGNGRLPDIVAAGGRLDKKGVISPSLEETRLRQKRYLEIYSQLRDFLEDRLGRSLMLMYGTLLGYHREGDFIPGDDDFDAGYVSDQTNPVAVKEETKGLIIELIRAGFTVSFNRKGRLFRVQLEREATDRFHLDVRPLWFQNGNVWLHNHCSFPATRDQFLPAAEGELHGVRVLVPRDTEAFLRGHYGPHWKVPDPGFMYYTSEIDPAVHENLSRALLTVREYRELAARVRREVGDAPPSGRLVSVGSQDLYPLDDYLA